MKNDFINNMTHELKTPISAVSLAAQMLQDESIDKSPEMIERLLGVIRSETKRLGFQVDKVLQMSMFDDKNTAALNMKELDANELISGIVNINEKQGLIEFIFSALGVLMGLFMVFMHNSVITVIVAVYLIIIPVVEIILSKDRLNTLKGEWLRILIGALLVVFLPAIFGAADAIFNVILTVCAIAVIALSVISFLISLYGFLKKPVAADVIETTATETEEK